MPAHGHAVFRRLHGLVNRRVRLPHALVPQHLPGRDFRVSQQNPPEGHIMAVNRSLAGAAGANVFLQRLKPVLGTLYVDTAFARLFLAEFAKTGHTAWITAAPAMHGA